jgi:hypothetical protein
MKTTLEYFNTIGKTAVVLEKNIIEQKQINDIYYLKVTTP